MRPAPAIRVRALNEHEPQAGDYVLYWMVAFRRPRWNYALEHAAAYAEKLGKPLVILEALRLGYRWASDRLHQFILDGMRTHASHFEEQPAIYLPYVEPELGAGRGLLATLAERACLVVSDDYPSFFIPKMQAAAAEKIHARLEVVDSNGLLPMRAAPKAFARAFDFRRFLQKSLPEHLEHSPLENPLEALPAVEPETAAAVLDRITRWPLASRRVLEGKTLDSMPLDHDVPRVDFEGGFVAAEQRLRDFLDGAYPRYGQDRNHPDDGSSSGLSPWLHFGHISAHHVFRDVAADEGWSLERVAPRANGARHGWWGMSENAEAFLDELVTWREVGFNMCALNPEYDRYDSLPQWARESLEAHESDPRPHLYTLEELAASKTGDHVWNAAQTELRETGRMHNYLRMLWGKRILEWTPSARDALAAMVELNNKYAVDGRDPNSYSGIFWVLGRYDRAWGPERPIFGKIRYMSSANTTKKLRMNDYLARFSGQAALFDRA